MRVLITGGYGCIGSWIIYHLLMRGDHVWVYDVRQDVHRLRLLLEEEQLAQVGFLAGDVTDLESLRQALELHGITHVIHLAALQVPICRADPLRGARVNVLGTLTVFEAIRALAGQVQRLVYASSSAVFGPPSAYPPGPIADTAPRQPATHYGVFKCANEDNARIYYQDHGLSSVGLRPGTVYGVGRDFGLTSEPTKALQALALGRPYAISYGGWQDFQYASDVAQTFLRCLETPVEGARVYNLRGTVTEIARFHQLVCQVEPRARELITFGSRQLDIAYDLDDQELQQDFGPLPRMPLPEGIRQTLELFRRRAAQGLLSPPEPPPAGNR
jgi:nucleoside-diphosphate-sugar epimerase